MIFLLLLCKQDQTSNRYDSILQWLQMENWLSVSFLLTQLLSYPNSRDAIASKNELNRKIILLGTVLL